MNALLRRQVRAAEYRDKASQATDLARASALANVREKHEVAAAKWSQLAALSEDDDRSGSTGSFRRLSL
jgi:hypothetical protein